MKDMYNDYSDTEFEYSYPISWIKRNKEYLKVRVVRNRKNIIAANRRVK